MLLAFHSFVSCVLTVSIIAMSLEHDKMHTPTTIQKRMPQNVL